MFPSRLTALFLLCGTLSGNAAIVVNCVGDSITAGVGAPNGESYPAKLQKLLGTNYLVQNFGVSGTTVLTNGDAPYRFTSSFIVSWARVPYPDIVVILLGSNDSKPLNWMYGTNFYSDYQNLAGIYTNATSHPRVLIGTPPPVFNTGFAGINPGIVATNIAPLVRQLGTNMNLQLIDFHSLLAGHSEWFPDNVHPNSKGTSVMAAIVYTALLGDTMNGSAPELQVAALPSSKALLTWPAAGAGWVLQSSAGLGDTNSWSVASQFAVNDGTSIRLTNTITGPTTLFRLWSPFPPSP
jgi:lysophospholipase L1-like esterase